MTPQELKNSILQLAIQGKLVPQCPSDGNAEDLYKKIQTEKQRLIAAGKIKKEKKLPEISQSEIPFDIPETWKWVRIGEVCDTYTGNSISENIKVSRYVGKTTGFDYIGTKDVSFDQRISYENGVKIPSNDGFKIAHKNSILLCIEGGSAGRKIGLLDRDVCFGNKLCAFNPLCVCPFNKFIFFYLQSSGFRDVFKSNLTGIIGGVSLRKIKDIPLPLPPLAEQKRIVEKIEELLPYVDRYEKAWNELEALNKRFPDDLQKSILQLAIQGKLVPQCPTDGNAEDLYKKIQTEKQRLIAAGKIKKEKPLPEISQSEIPFDIPETWKWVRLGEIIKLVSGTDFKPEEYNDGGKGTPYITGASSLSPNGVLVSRWTETPRITANLGDLLIVCKGSGYGKTAICNVSSAHIARQIMAIKSTENLSMKYIQQFLRACIALIKTKGQGVIPGIDRGSILSITFPLPPLAEQKRIVEKIEELLPMIKTFPLQN